MSNKPWLGVAGLTVMTLVTLPVKTGPTFSPAFSPASASVDTADTAAPVRIAPQSAVLIRIPAAFGLTRHIVPVAAVAPAKLKSKRAAYAVRMRGTDAMSRLRNAGLRWRASGKCTDPAKPWCTSLHTIRYGTLAKTIELKRRSGCRITITGGTETGHAKGVYSHRNGYKVDVEPSKCVDGYIKKRFPFFKTRGDGAPLYRSPENDLYARETSHWDILFR